MKIIDATSGTPETKVFHLPDGRCITIDDKSHRCAETLFDPSLVGLKGVSIANVVDNINWKQKEVLQIN